VSKVIQPIIWFLKVDNLLVAVIVLAPNAKKLAMPLVMKISRCQQD
jgi:hypothetical protein